MTDVMNKITKLRKETISSLIGAIKKVAIDENLSDFVKLSNKTRYSYHPVTNEKEECVSCSENDNCFFCPIFINNILAIVFHIIPLSYLSSIFASFAIDIL